MTTNHVVATRVRTDLLFTQSKLLLSSPPMAAPRIYRAAAVGQPLITGPSRWSPFDGRPTPRAPGRGHDKRTFKFSALLE